MAWWVETDEIGTPVLDIGVKGSLRESDDACVRKTIEIGAVEYHSITVARVNEPISKEFTTYR